MSELQEVEGSIVVSWIDSDPDRRIGRLVGTDFADSNDEWLIEGSRGPLLLLRHAGAGAGKSMRYEALADGTLYLLSDDPILSEIESEKSPFQKALEEARLHLKRSGLCGNAVLADTQAVSLFRVLQRWNLEAIVPTIEEAYFVTDLFEIAAPSTRQACSLLEQWTLSVARSSERRHETVSFGIQHASLLRAANRPDEAISVVSGFCDSRSIVIGQSPRAVLLTIRAAALMDLYERDRKPERLDEAERRLKNAWAIEGANEFLMNTYRRFDALKKAA